MIEISPWYMSVGGTSEQKSIDELLGDLFVGIPQDHRAQKELLELRENLATFRKLASLRQHGWTVAVHNDYILDGVHMTFWGFSRGHQWVKGEGETDLEALNDVLEEVRELGAAVKKVGG